MCDQSSLSARQQAEGEGINVSSVLLQPPHLQQVHTAGSLLPSLSLNKVLSALLTDSLKMNELSVRANLPAHSYLPVIP